RGEPLDGGRNPNGEPRRVEAGERPDSAPAGKKAGPGFWGRQPYGRNGSNPRDDRARHETSEYRSDFAASREVSYPFPRLRLPVMVKNTNILSESWQITSAMLSY